MQFAIGGAVALFVIALMMGGGSARGDVLSLLYVRLSALAVTLLILWNRPSDNVVTSPEIFFCAAALLTLVQLVPLPPKIWAALPGHDFYLPAARLTGSPEPWRPLTLTPDGTWNAVLALVPVAAAILAAQSAPPQRILIAILGAALVSVLFAMIQQTDGPTSALRLYRQTNPDSGVGLLANRNHQALLMAMAIPTAALWSTQPTRRGASPAPRMAIGASLVLLFCLGGILTQSRAGALLLPVALLGAALLVVPALRLTPTARRAAGAALAAVVVGGSIAALSLSRLWVAIDPSDPRARGWTTTMEYIWTFFPLGSGAGSFPLVYPRFEKTPDLRPTYLNHAHNDLMEIGTDYGLAGYVLLAAFLAWFFTMAYRVWRRSPRREWEGQLGPYATIIIALGLAASLADYPLRAPLMSSLFAAACVILAQTASRGTRQSRDEAARSSSVREAVY